MSVLVVGSVALDSVETPAARVDRVVGGSATFFSAAASLLAGVRVVGVVGDDFPVDRLGFLRDRGVDMAGLARRSGESFFWAGRYHEGFRGRTTLETRLGVFASFDPVVPPAFRDSPVVFLGNIDPVLQLGVLDQVRAPRLVAADTMDFWIDGARDALIELLARIDVLFVNDEEALHLAGRDTVARAAAWIRARGPEMVVVKRGDQGATLFADGSTFSCPAYPVPAVVDPTGAGDAFAGGFLGYLAGPGTDLRQALVLASAMGSYAVEDFSVDRFRGLDADAAMARAEALRGSLEPASSVEGAPSVGRASWAEGARSLEHA